ARGARGSLWRRPEDIVVMFAATPLIRPETLRRLRSALAEGAAVAVLGFTPADPKGYGRLITQDGMLVAIREEKDAIAAEQDIRLCNAGLMALTGAHALALLERIGNDN